MSSLDGRTLGANGRKVPLRADMCTELSYRFKFKTSEFDFGKFHDAIGKSVEIEGWNETVLDPFPEAEDKYHAHVRWKESENDDEFVRLRIDYHMWDADIELTSVRPYAEEFFEWLAPFYSGDAAEAHIHAEFSFPSETWQSKIVPLPLKVPYAGKSAVIDGVSIDLPGEPEGVRSVWIHKHRKSLELQLYADKRFGLVGFHPQNDIDSLRVVIKSLVEERQS